MRITGMGKKPMQAVSAGPNSGAMHGGPMNIAGAVNKGSANSGVREHLGGPS